MPQYEYVCNDCAWEFERTCRIGERHNTVCPMCCSTNWGLKVSYGYTHGDEAVWINNEIRGSLQDDKDARRNPITSRTEYKNYLKTHDIVERA